MSEESLETLQAKSVKLRGALIRLMRSFPTDSDLIAASWEELEIDEAMRAHDAASAVLAESAQCNAVSPAVCKTCGGSRVDPGGLPACRDCTLISPADEQVCKGSFVLGNGCGKCSGCIGEMQHHGRPDAPTVSAQPEITGHNLSTSAGGRGYVAEYFSKRMNRHDFGRYITERLAADFACALAAHLDSLPAAPTPPASATSEIGKAMP